jgi:type IV pilus assembly protein PilO
LFREKQQITIFIVAAVVLAGFVLFRYMPLNKKMKTVQQERAMQNLTIAKGMSDCNQLPLFQEQLLKLINTCGDYNTIIPGQRNLGIFTGQIAELMQQQNLKGQEIVPREEIQTDGLSCIPVSMKCNGDLKQIFSFFNQLQKLDRLIRIEKVKLINDGNLTGQVAVETDVVIYYRPESSNG